MSISAILLQRLLWIKKRVDYDAYLILSTILWCNKCRSLLVAEMYLDCWCVWLLLHIFLCYQWLIYSSNNNTCLKSCWRSRLCISFIYVLFRSWCMLFIIIYPICLDRYASWRCTYVSLHVMHPTDRQMNYFALFCSFKIWQHCSTGKQTH
jgi:hypothetical protein